MRYAQCAETALLGTFKKGGPARTLKLHRPGNDVPVAWRSASAPVASANLLPVGNAGARKAAPVPTQRLDDSIKELWAAIRTLEKKNAALNLAHDRLGDEVRALKRDAGREEVVSQRDDAANGAGHLHAREGHRVRSRYELDPEAMARAWDSIQDRERRERQARVNERQVLVSATAWKPETAFVKKYYESSRP